MLRHVTYHADYLNPASRRRPSPNQVDKSIQTTRRFDALKLWLTLRIMGADAIGALFDEAIDLAARVGTVLAADPDFELAAAPQLSTLVFRYRPAAAGRQPRCPRTARTASTRPSAPPSSPPARPWWPEPRSPAGTT